MAAALGTMAQSEETTYRNIYWTEAFSSIMQPGTSLEQKDFVDCARTLLLQVLANNILRNTALANPEYQVQLINDFYEEYKKNLNTTREGLLTTLFMKTLIDFDEAKCKLQPDDRLFLTNISLKLTFKDKKFRLLRNGHNQFWIMNYMFAKIPPETIRYNVQQFKSLGEKKYLSMLDYDQYVVHGMENYPKGLPPEITELFHEGWYVLFKQKKFTVQQVGLLCDAVKNPEKWVATTDAKVTHILGQYLMIKDQYETPETKTQYWEAKKMNIGAFYETINRSKI